jgi:hypothetical protein
LPTVKSRLPLFALLGASVAFLVSLYFPWIAAGDPGKPVVTHLGAGSILNLFGSSFGVDGWGVFGQAAALAAVALGLLAVVSLVRPELEASLPIGGCAIALAVLALVSVADLRTQALYRAGYHGLTVHLGTGAYVGGAAALAALLSAAWVSHDDIAEPGKAAVATLLTIGVVAAYVLPTLTVHLHPLFGSGGYQFAGGSSGTAIMLLIASFGLTFWFGAKTPPLRRIAAAAVVLVLVVGGYSAYGTHVHWPYEAWIAIGCAAGLFVLAVATNRGPGAAWLVRRDAIALAGAALFLASLFLHWESFCTAPHGATCYVGTGWSGGFTGGLVAILVVLHLGFRRLLPELAVTVAIYAIGLSLNVTIQGSLGYGAYLGFAGVALLLIAVCLPPRPPLRLGVSLVGVVASLGFIAIPVAALSGRLPSRIEFFETWTLHLLQAAAIVLTLRLVGRWLTRRAADRELLLLPVALLTLTILDLVEKESVLRMISWEGWLSLALAAFLVVLGWIAQRGSLEKFRVPDEFWRVDRISTGEN